MILDRNAWDEKAELVKDGYVGLRGETASSMNSRLRMLRDQMKDTIKYFEANDINPDEQMLQYKFEEKISRFITPKTQRSTAPAARPKSLLSVFDEFMYDCGTMNAWSEGTYGKMHSLKMDLREFRKNIKFSDLNEKTLTAFVTYLREEKALPPPRKKKGDRDEYNKEDVTGLRNSTIFKKLGYLRWFLNWATEKGYNTQMAYRSFHPTLKTTQTKVIYLTTEELKRLIALACQRSRSGSLSATYSSSAAFQASGSQMPRPCAGPTSKPTIWRSPLSRPPTAFRLKSTM